MKKRTYHVIVVVEGDNPEVGKPALSERTVSEYSADSYEIGRRLRGTFASTPKMSVTSVTKEGDTR